MDEVWKAIEGYRGTYEVSSEGRVRSVPMPHQARKRSRIRILRLVLVGSKWTKYFAVSLSQDGHVQRWYVNRLVAEAFLGRPPTMEMQAAHLDGDSFNNRATNLVWATPQQNCDHKKMHGTIPLGERSALSKLKDQQVFEIRDRRAKGEALSVLASDFGVSESLISQIARRVIWRHLPEGFHV